MGLPGGGQTAAVVPKAAEHVLHVLSGGSVDLGLRQQHLLLPARRTPLGAHTRWFHRVHFLRCTVLDHGGVGRVCVVGRGDL
jgi:hypothetical protein